MRDNTNRNVMENDFVTDGGKSKSRFYCIDCSKFTEDGLVIYDSNDHPVVQHNNGHKHHVIFGTDIQRLLELDTLQLDQIMRYETAEMYDISVEKLEQVLANIREDF
jgi:hypothetical protein